MINKRYTTKSSDNMVTFNPLLLIESSLPIKPPAHYQTYRKYHYKNFSILETMETDGAMVCHIVSIAAHGINSQPLHENEVGGLLFHLGFNPIVPCEYWETPHPWDPTFGDTHYYRQSIVA